MLFTFPSTSQARGGKKGQIVVYIPIAHTCVCISLKCSSVAHTYVDSLVTDEMCLPAGRHLL